MPRIRLLLPIGRSSWTKVPNRLLDRLLPELRDTELRILLHLIRQTAGWQREGKEVRLTYRQLMEATGRRSEAVASALASLRSRGLIHVAGPHAGKSPRPPKRTEPETEAGQ